MNKNKIRMIAAPLIVGAMLMTAGCGEVNPLKSTSADKKTVMTVGGEKVAYQEYRYFWMNNKRDLYGADAELTPEQTEKIKQLVETNVTDRHALRLLAAEYGVELTDEDMETTVPVFSPGDYDGITEFIMENSKDFTHFNGQGRAKMVNVGEKEITHRTATAAARVLVSPETFQLIQSGGMKKGDVLTVAQIAGIMGAKRTPDLIPMCHPVQLSGADLTLELDEARCSVEIRATVTCDGRTGVEMEALTAVSTAALTVYDMCKAVQKDMVISDIRLLSKTGGVHGEFHREESV